MFKLIGSDGKEYGPVSAEEIRRWLAEGRIHLQTLVSSPGDRSWCPLGSVPELNPSPAVPFGPPPLTAKPGNPMALLGLVCGLIALFCCCCCGGFPFNLMALVFSLVGLNQAENEGDRNSKTLALVGLVCALLSVAQMTLAPLLSWIAGLLQNLPR